MALMNIKLAKSAYMLEFLTNDMLSECFTFSVPPENEELDFPHRIAETKTFGGSIFDNYGNDTIHITLSGSTINNDVKMIYRGIGEAPSFMTGEEEIFYLQKLITNWYKTDNINDKKEIYLYDLSKASLLEMASGKPTRNYWQVIIKDLKIKRDKTKPFTYNYTLEMSAIENDNRGSSTKFSDNVSDILSTVNNVIRGIQGVVKTVEGYTALCDSVMRDLQVARNRYLQKINGNTEGMTPYEITSTYMCFGCLSNRLFTGETNNSFYNSTRDLLDTFRTFELNTRDIDRTLEPLDTKDDSLPQAKNYNLEWNNKTVTYGKKDCIIVFDSRGGTPVPMQRCGYCYRATRPKDPTKEGFRFLGWYIQDASGTEKQFAFGDITSDIKLFAGWEALQNI